MALPIYSTGSVSVAAGGTVVTGTGGLWSGINVKQGDFININNVATVLITEVTDATHLKIPPWPGAAQSGVAYTIYQNYVGRVVGVAAAEDVGTMLEKLHTTGLPFLVEPDQTAPDPSYGDEGQMAYQATTQTWWVKSGGFWVETTAISGVPDAPSNDIVYGRQNLAWTPIDSGGKGGGAAGIRLSLTANTAITSADSSGPTIYGVPVGAGGISIYNGSHFVGFGFDTDRVLVLDSTGHPANNQYSVFAYFDGTDVKLGTGPAWVSATNPGTGAG